jgi:hypothetical protein
MTDLSAVLPLALARRFHRFTATTEPATSLGAGFATPEQERLSALPNAKHAGKTLRMPSTAESMSRCADDAMHTPHTLELARIERILDGARTLPAVSNSGKVIINPVEATIIITSHR